MSLLASLLPPCSSIYPARHRDHQLHHPPAQPPSVPWAPEARERHGRPWPLGSPLSPALEHMCAPVPGPAAAFVTPWLCLCRFPCRDPSPSYVSVMVTLLSSFLQVCCPQGEVPARPACVGCIGRLLHRHEGSCHPGTLFFHCLGSWDLSLPCPLGLGVLRAPRAAVLSSGGSLHSAFVFVNHP